MTFMKKTFWAFILGSNAIQGDAFQLRFGASSDLLGPNSVTDRLEAYLDDLGSASTLEDQRKKHPAGYMYTFNKDKSISAGRTVLPGGSSSYLGNLNGATASPTQTVSSSPPAKSNGAVQSSEPLPSASLVMPNSVTDKLEAYLDNLGSSSTVKDQRKSYSKGFMYTFNKENPKVFGSANLPGGSSSYLGNLNGAVSQSAPTMSSTVAAPPQPQSAQAPNAASQGSSSTVKDQRKSYSRGYMYTFNKENPKVVGSAVLPGGSSSYLGNLNGAITQSAPTTSSFAAAPPQNVQAPPAATSNPVTQQSESKPQKAVSIPPPPPPTAVSVGAPGQRAATQEADDEELTFKPFSQWTLSEVVLTFLFTLLFAEVLVYFYGTGFFDNLNSAS